MTQTSEILILDPVFKKHIVHFVSESFHDLSSLFLGHLAFSEFSIVTKLSIFFVSFTLEFVDALDFGSFFNIEVSKWIFLVFAMISRHHKVPKLSLVTIKEYDVFVATFLVWTEVVLDDGVSKIELREKCGKEFCVREI